MIQNPLEVQATLMPTALKERPGNLDKIIWEEMKVLAQVLSIERSLDV